MKLPKVILNRGEYRLVAVREAPGTADAWHAEKWVLNKIEMVFEKRTLDSLGEARWDKCTTDEGSKMLLLEEVVALVGKGTPEAKKLLVEDSNGITREPANVVIGNKAKAKK